MRRRWTIRILVCLLLGIVTTIAVAWGAAVWPPTMTDVPPDDETALYHLDILQFKHDNRFVAFVMRESWAVTAVEVWEGQGLLPHYMLGARTTQFLQTDVARLDPRAILDVKRELRDSGFAPVPSWSAARRPFGLNKDTQQISDGGVHDRGFGWPARGLSYATVASLADDLQLWELTESEGLWRLHDSQLSWDEVEFLDQFHGLPFRPIWSGFLLNTLFYTVVWFILFFGPGQARRMIRRKRGRCPQCGYNLRGEFDSGCSECGWNRGQREVDSPPLPAQPSRQ